MTAPAREIEAYAALCPSCQGRITLWADAEAYRDDIASEVAEHIRNGYEIHRIGLEDARAGGLGHAEGCDFSEGGA